MDIPPIPDAGPRLRAPVPLRFEDVTQDGRLVLDTLPNALVPTLWRGFFAGSAGARALRAEGIVPILTRLRIEATAGPFSTGASVEAEATYCLSRADDGRYMLDMWADLSAPLGRTNGLGQTDGTRVSAGRVLAEHVLTRPFAAPGERRVTHLDFPEAPAVTGTRAALPPFESIATAPLGATPLEPSMLADPVPTAFGLLHTDSNRHVNSLVYLRLFEEAALRRFTSLGRGSLVLARKVDIAYRKPCFAGQSAVVAQQAFQDEQGQLGVAAVLITPDSAPAYSSGGPPASPGGPRERPFAYTRMRFEP